MIRHATLLLVLAACPAKQAANPQPAAAGGCPAASGVYVASYARTGWVVPLHSTPDAGNAGEYARIDAAAASAAGAPAIPTGTMWLATPNAAPCRAKPGSYFSAKVDGTPASVSYGFELEGCPAPPNPDEAGGILLISEQDPSGCRFEPPQTIAARIGEMDKAKQWQRPTKETPIPPAITAAIPPHECAPPGCETLWAFGEVKVNNATVAWSGAINWLQVGAPEQQCSWPAERFSGFFIPSGNGAVKVTEGQDKPLVLSAALVDSGGAKVLLAEGPGEYATYDLAPGKATLGHHITYLAAPPDAWDAVDHLGPICEQQR
jgi:hypothetical protein